MTISAQQLVSLFITDYSAINEIVGKCLDNDSIPRHVEEIKFIENLNFLLGVNLDKLKSLEVTDGESLQLAFVALKESSHCANTMYDIILRMGDYEIDGYEYFEATKSTFEITL